MFQFYSSSIKTTSDILAIICQETFQFYSSSIKTKTWELAADSVKAFQFYSSSIKTGTSLKTTMPFISVSIL